MTNPEQIRLLQAIEQTDAIFAFEGFAQTDERKAINTAILAGRITHAQVAVEIREYVMQNKTVSGFMNSRAWS